MRRVRRLPDGEGFTNPLAGGPNRPVRFPPGHALQSELRRIRLLGAGHESRKLASELMREAGWKLQITRGPIGRFRSHSHARKTAHTTRTPGRSPGIPP
jgi:hypothetical protein